MTAKTKKTKTTHARVYKHKPRGVSARSFERAFWPYLPLTLLIGLLLMFSSQSGALSAALRNPRGNVLACLHRSQAQKFVSHLKNVPRVNHVHIY